MRFRIGIEGKCAQGMKESIVGEEQGCMKTFRGISPVSKAAHEKHGMCKE